MYHEYDDPTFFEAYANMARSKDGLRSAGEWYQLQPLFPDLSGKRMLDLGCGYGWHCQYAIKHGAACVLGIDASHKMIATAKERNDAKEITYRVCGIEEYEYPPHMWDVVVSNLALHYIEDVEHVFQLVHQTLKPQGVFIFNIEHPIFTAGVNQDWIYSSDQEPLYWPVDQYFIPGKRHTQFLGCEVMKQHHTLTQLLMGLLNNGFELEVVEEVKPSAEMLKQPGMADELRRPMMLLIRAKVRT